MTRRLSQTARAKRRRELYAERLADPYLLKLMRVQQYRQAEAVRKDPVRLEAQRQRKRVWEAANKAKRQNVAQSEQLREQRRAQYVAQREREGKPAGVSRANGRPRADAKPFRRWLLAYGQLIGETEAGPIAADLGLVARRVQALMYEEQPLVSLDVVDRALQNSGPQVTLRIGGHPRVIFNVDDLYPRWWVKR